ncbi:unnamed protein product [Protopolystoma xenopodis]|uniref:Uncharacterized protein n=1 Tax=Protopolystoma xenopodis TaxID=117903 RepID=A0A3S5CNT7_9PLAT|nr:unnamed protein product [Protopolystoma xenopodis]
MQAGAQAASALVFQLPILPPGAVEVLWNLRQALPKRSSAFTALLIAAPTIWPSELRSGLRPACLSAWQRGMRMTGVWTSLLEELYR